MRFPDIWAPAVIESVPTVFMQGESIVEVTFTEWRTWDLGHGDSSWRMVGGDSVPVPGTVDRIIYELPIGCYESVVQIDPGTVHFAEGGTSGTPLRPCQRSVHAAIEASREGSTA